MESEFERFLGDWEENSRDTLLYWKEIIPNILKNFTKSNKSYYKGVGVL